MPGRRLRRGDSIGGFTLEDLLHQGGMARLWGVSHPAHDLPLLMKMPLLREGDDPTVVVGFEVEQMIMPRLSGPHVPRFVAAGLDGAQPWLVMERIPGQTAEREKKDLPLAVNEIVRIGSRTAQALTALHAQNVVHLDIKPGNIMFRPDGKAVLIDFGLSRHAQLPDLLQEEFRIPIGTAPYMAPEQVMRIRSDSRSDIFSLGVMLYHLATGHYPFGQSSTGTGLRRRLWRDPEPPARINAAVPPWLQEVILHALEPDPQQRYATAAQMRFDLQHPDQVVLGSRANRTRQDGIFQALRRRLQAKAAFAAARKTAPRNWEAPIAMVAIDPADGAEGLPAALRLTASRLMTIAPAARLACVSVLKTSATQIDRTLDDEGRNRHLMQLVALKHWGQSLAVAPERLSFHVLEAVDPAAALLEFALSNHVDHVVIGARGSSALRRHLGSVSSEVVARAQCSVTVVRLPQEGGRWLSLPVGPDVDPAQGTGTSLAP